MGQSEAAFWPIVKRGYQFGTSKCGEWNPPQRIAIYFFAGNTEDSYLSPSQIGKFFWLFGSVDTIIFPSKILFLHLKKYTRAHISVVYTFEISMTYMFIWGLHKKGQTHRINWDILCCIWVRFVSFCVACK